MSGILQERGSAVPNGALSDLETYLEAYREGFRRRDQARWAAVYVQGLLLAEGRRNVENLARAVTLPEGQRAEDLAQALGHFVNHSPWDEADLWRRHVGRIAGGEGVFVLEEMALVKQGRHSAGVHRQYSRALGRKVNCQLAVVLHHVGPAGHVPLSLQLYLPRGWLNDPERLASAGIPESALAVTGKSAIATELIDAARDGGLRAPAMAAGPGWQFTEEVESAAAMRGMRCLPEVPPQWAATFVAGRNRLEELGIGHFEGRSWRGFHHHACLVMMAHGFRSDE